MATEDKAPSPTKTPDIRISDEAKLEEWLRKVPLVWAQAISARAALRVLPVECDVFEFKNDLPSGTLIRCLANFRASFISWAARKYPAHDMSTVAAEAAKAAIAAEAPTYQPSFAATAVRVAAHRADGAKAAAEAVAGTVGAATLMAAQIAELMHADVTIWNAITIDANWLMGNGKGAHPSVQAQELMEQPLWLEDVRGDPKFKANFPLWARKPFDAFANSALVKNGLWKHWVDWYRAILPNSPTAKPRSVFGERADIEIATQPPGFWERDPDEVMADISRVIRGEPIVAESSAPGDGESDDTRQPQDLAVDPEKKTDK